MAVFTLDGVTYDVLVPRKGIKRSGKILDGDNAGRNKPGDMIRDIIGTYYNYSMQIDTSRLNAAAYDQLYEALTAPVDSHTLKVPYGQGTITFEAYIANVDDTLDLMEDTRNLWGELTVNFIAMSPHRTP